MQRSEHSAEEKEHGQRMVQRVQLHMHEGTLGRYRKGGRGSSQEPENVPRSRTGQLVELSTVRTPILSCTGLTWPLAGNVSNFLTVICSRQVLGNKTVLVYYLTMRNESHTQYGAGSP